MGEPTESESTHGWWGCAAVGVAVVGFMVAADWRDDPEKGGRTLRALGITAGLMAAAAFTLIWRVEAHKAGRSSWVTRSFDIAAGLLIAAAVVAGVVSEVRDLFDGPDHHRGTAEEQMYEHGPPHERGR